MLYTQRQRGYCGSARRIPRSGRDQLTVKSSRLILGFLAELPLAWYATPRRPSFWEANRALLEPPGLSAWSSVAECGAGGEGSPGRSLQSSHGSVVRSP